MVAQELASAASPLRLGEAGGFRFEARFTNTDLWIVASANDREIAAVRTAHSLQGLTLAFSGDGTFELTSREGAIRVKVAFVGEDCRVARCTTSLLPSHDLVVPAWPRDLCIFGDTDGTVHTQQRGLRSGIIFGSAGAAETPFSFFYFQNFSALSDFFAVTKQTPADCVGGRWPELGYSPPGNGDAVLPKAREFVVSDAFLLLSTGAPATDAEVAAQYLDSLAEIYLSLPRPEPAYHEWPDRAAKTLRDLSFSPDCAYMRRGQRYLMPYVGDATKPPESMVQYTMLVNVLEYDSWRNAESILKRDLCAVVPSFFDEEVGSVVRWLPGEDFGEQSEEMMSHEAMDSWYFYHSLFNLSRLAREGHAKAAKLFRRSLDFAMRVARRFDYRWPVFFNLRTLDVMRGESEPGQGGENDVAGLYALVMLQACELFGDRDYLAEAERASESLLGLGFSIGYQMNTTGFAAEAMQRLWKKTRNRRYLELSEICLANMFDNMWLWDCRYDRARNYPTFFGLMPLHGAPYLAAYEELEAQAKFHVYLELGGDDVRPSIKLLMAEYQKYSLDRAWYYFPDTLPKNALAEKPRNGRIERTLSIPLEDLQEGHKPSGEVGQEVYGAGAPFVYTTRHYTWLSALRCYVFCSYPLYEFRAHSARIGGDVRGSCQLRIIPVDPDTPFPDVRLTVRAGEQAIEQRGKKTPEGHLLFSLRGGQTFTISKAGN